MLINKLKQESEMDPNKHDGSYKLVEEVVKALKKIDNTSIGIEDLDMLYFMTVGTWTSSFDNKKNIVEKSNLLEKDKGIFIKNIYYMLTYAFRVLKQTNYEDIESEDFNHVLDLLAAILSKGISQQLKQVLYKEYIVLEEDLPTIKGKLAINKTINNLLERKKLLHCQFDDLSENNLLNSILKTTALLLISEPRVKNKYKISLKKNMLYFSNVDEIDPRIIRWSELQFNRNNRNYQMLITICYFVLRNMLLTTDKGQYRVASFVDETGIDRLYERFVLEYYKYHHPVLKAGSRQIRWNIDDGIDEFLPVMKTDIMLEYGEKVLIIDTKYYKNTMQGNPLYNSKSIHSNNLYQIFSYVKNKDTNNTGKVSGMLLYAKTKEEITPDNDFLMDGNKISVKTLDLNRPFSDIAKTLDNIAFEFTRG